MRRFTLIELLVVVAIIGILASMLLPAVSKGRERAKTAVCLSTIKQIGIGISSYTTDSEYFPYGAASTGNLVYDDLINIDNRPQSIMKQNGISSDDFQSKAFECPSDEIDRGDFIKRSYSMSLGTDWGRSTFNGVTTMVGLSKLVGQVRNPTETLLLSERIKVWNRLGKDSSAGMGFYDLDHWKDGVHNGSTTKRNALFVDGHASLESDPKIWGTYMVAE
ncbi:MAG: type II secretion system GspH family protein [Lentisphaeraceae bacterium]|nr:type II secretion system GspH family protein [Lentisphaeraceae bacterium]